MKVTVIPKSKKAKNRFHNLMDRNPNVRIIFQKGQNLFVASENEQNFFWVPLNGNDDWGIVFP